MSVVCDVCGFNGKSASYHCRECGRRYVPAPGEGEARVICDPQTPPEGPGQFEPPKNLDEAVSALLAEREAREQAERAVDSLREQVREADTRSLKHNRQLVERAERAEANRDAAVARADAEIAERQLAAVDEALPAWEAPPGQRYAVGRVQTILNLKGRAARAEQAEAERDEARKMLGECYLLSGADPDGNDWPHLWRDAAEEVGRMRKDYDTETRRADAAEARVRQLEEALKPFAVTAPLGGDGRPEFSNEDLLARTVALWNRAAPGQDGYDNSLFSRLVTAIKAARAALSPDPSCRP